MPDYSHRYLTINEKYKFIELFNDNADKNYLIKIFFKYHLVAILYPFIILSLLYLTISNSVNILNDVVVFVLGLITIQIKFCFAHMWAHSLMLEYDLWSVKTMPQIFGQISFVIFYAFYHHHHEKDDDWMPRLLKHSEFTDSFATAFTHWESFSLFTQTYPINHLIIKSYVFYNLYTNPISIPFFLGHEVGVILLPIAHDWVHFRLSNKFGSYYLLKPLEWLGIFATKEDHKRHH